MSDNHPRKIKKIIRASEKHWVGDGFYVSTMFSMHSEDPLSISPFLMLDYASPKHFEPTEEKLGVGEHPHRGFETVTFAVRGSIDHRDSGGGGGRIHTGGVQWMTAGSGVVHEEFHSREFAKTGGEFSMIQLWVNLPAEHKMTKPRYQGLNLEDFPILEEDGIEIKVIAGHFNEEKGPAQSFTPINMFEAKAKMDGSVKYRVENGSTTLIVQTSGKSLIAGEELQAGEVALLEKDGENLVIEMTKDSHFLLLNGEPIDEPVASYGPFVMNTKEEILRAVEDFQAGRMGRL